MKNLNVGPLYNSNKMQWENCNKSDLKRKLLYELQLKKLNDQLEQITMFKQKQNKEKI